MIGPLIKLFKCADGELEIQRDGTGTNAQQDTNTQCASLLSTSPCALLSLCVRDLGSLSCPPRCVGWGDGPASGPLYRLVVKDGAAGNWDSCLSVSLYICLAFSLYSCVSLPSFSFYNFPSNEWKSHLLNTNSINTFLSSDWL